MTPAAHNPRPPTYKRAAATTKANKSQPIQIGGSSLGLPGAGNSTPRRGARVWVFRIVKSLRADMPVTAALVDEMREAFGAEMINAAIRGGISGRPTFFARENGHEIGTALDGGGSDNSKGGNDG